MEYEIKKLVAKDDRIYTVDGEYICTVSMTREVKDLLDDVGRDPKESWLTYRNRTAKQREDERLKRVSLVRDMVTAYNNLLVNSYKQR